MDRLRILFKLCGGYGLGDVAQFSVILKHLRRYKPEWSISVMSPRGMHSALYGLCEQSCYYGELEPPHDRAMDLELFEAFTHYADRPSNKTTYFLLVTFGIDYDASLGRYEVRVSQAVRHRFFRWLTTVAEAVGADKFKVVCVQYQGGSSPARKNLQHWQAEQIVAAIKQAGRVPILLDWHQSPIQGLRVPDAVWGGFGAGDAEGMAALIGMSEAFIGIDSGPGKVASATETPSLIVWTKNHPLRYHDPAPNTTHLIPAGWQGMIPVEWDADREAYFCSHYFHRTYQGEHDLVGEACWWLMERLGQEGWDDPGVTFVVPPGEEQARWCLAKIPSLLGDWRHGKIIVSGDRWQELPGMDLYREAGYSVKAWPIPVHLGPERPQNTRGHYLYVSDGYRDGYHFLVPDVMMQQGKGIEDWLPDVPVSQLADRLVKGWKRHEEKVGNEPRRVRDKDVRNHSGR